ncbi:MAG: hypothetical protein ACRC0X_02690 [Brevinema sp.]
MISKMKTYGFNILLTQTNDPSILHFEIENRTINIQIQKDKLLLNKIFEKQLFLKCQKFDIAYTNLKQEIEKCA